MVGTVQDVTTLRRAGQELRDAELRSRTVADFAYDWAYWLNPEGGMNYVSPSSERVTGYTARDFLDDTSLINEIVVPEDRDIWANHRYDAFEAEGFREVQFRIRRRDGRVRWIEHACRPVTDDMGNFLGFRASNRDITDRKQAEEALRESDERFRQLADSIDDVFLLNSADLGEVLYVSPVYEKIWGRTCESLYDRPTSWLDAVHPDDAEIAKSTFARARVEETDAEFRITRPDGSLRWVQTRSYPIRDESGEVYRIAGVASDITEEKRLRQESEERLQQVIQADRLSSLGQVVAGVAHEINNPNSFISYNVPLLREIWGAFRPVLTDYAAAHPDWERKGLRFGELIEDMGDIIESIRTGSDRINRVVSDLKDFARLDGSIQTRPLEVNEVVDKTLTIVGAQLRKSVGRIDEGLARGLPKVDGHFQKLEQVAANLLVNASQAIPSKAEGRVSITTRYLKRLRSVLIEVEDNGTGMKPEVVDRIFNPFFTTRREEKGTGLGLSVSRSLVEEHGGVIGVLSRPGLGTRFTVYLPVDKKVRLDLRPTVLCVDKNRDMAARLRQTFSGIGAFPVETANDAEAVPAYLDDHPEVDMVFSEIDLPGVSGWELLERVKSRFPLVAVILYSSSPGALKRKSGATFPPDFLLEKGFEAGKILQIVNAIGRQRL
jgi:PAS domain S-box-containing protein